MPSSFGLISLPVALLVFLAKPCTAGENIAPNVGSIGLHQTYTRDPDVTNEEYRELFRRCNALMARNDLSWEAIIEAEELMEMLYKEQESLLDQALQIGADIVRRNNSDSRFKEFDQVWAMIDFFRTKDANHPDDHQVQVLKHIEDNEMFQALERLRQRVLLERNWTRRFLRFFSGLFSCFRAPQTLPNANNAESSDLLDQESTHAGPSDFLETTSSSSTEIDIESDRLSSQFEIPFVRLTPELHIERIDLSLQDLLLLELGAHSNNVFPSALPEALRTRSDDEFLEIQPFLSRGGPDAHEDPLRMIQRPDNLIPSALAEALLTDSDSVILELLPLLSRGELGIFEDHRTIELPYNRILSALAEAPPTDSNRAILEMQRFLSRREPEIRTNLPTIQLPEYSDEDCERFLQRLWACESDLNQRLYILQMQLKEAGLLTPSQLRGWRRQYEKFLQFVKEQNIDVRILTKIVSILKNRQKTQEDSAVEEAFMIRGRQTAKYLMEMAKIERSAEIRRRLPNHWQTYCDICMNPFRSGEGLSPLELLEFDPETRAKMGWKQSLKEMEEELDALKQPAASEDSAEWKAAILPSAIDESGQYVEDKLPEEIIFCGLCGYRVCRSCIEQVERGSACKCPMCTETLLVPTMDTLNAFCKRQAKPQCTSSDV